MTLTLLVNGETHDLDVDPDMPLLWALREQLGFTGTKYGCGIAQCGACTVHLNGRPVPSCTVPVSAAAGQRVTTIEGLANGDKPHPVQVAWVEVGVPQCGYCQSGQIMSAVALLADRPNPTDAEIDAAMARNLCRCGTYLRIRLGLRKAAALMAKQRAQS